MHWVRVVSLWASAVCAGCDGAAGGPQGEPNPGAQAQPQNAEQPGADAPRHASAKPPDGEEERACDEQHPKRCFDLARALPAGSDTRQLVALLEPACAGGLPQACYSLAAVLTKGGPGVPADPARARELTEQACREGSQSACDALGH